MFFDGVDAMLDDARSRLDRISAEQAYDEVSRGEAVLVDIRPASQREADGQVAASLGPLVVERNHLEWRLHPDSDARLPAAAPGQRWIVVCTEGYTSSLAADSLNSIGVPATDLEGGYLGWRAAGLPTVSGPPTPTEQVVDGVSSAR
jgi:rhodanese-related sulfurtransferase